MAIDWGSWEYAGGNGMRVGIEVTWSAVSHSSTSTTATIDIWTDNQYTYSDNQTLTYGGSISGTTSYTNNDGSTAQLRATKTYTYTYSSGSYGSSPGTRTFTAAVSGTYNGVTPSNSVTSSIPARPAAVPSAPRSFAADNSTVGQLALSWSAPSDNGGASVTGYTLKRGSTTIFSNSNVTSYTDTGLSPNTSYTYTVAAVNSVGTSTTASVTSTTLGGLGRIWNGTAYVSVIPKVWNGTAWVDAQARIWNGTEWKYGS